MNKSYRSVWNESTGTWVAVQENAKGRGKQKSGAAKVAVTGAMLVTGAFAGAPVAYAAGSTPNAPGLELCYNGSPYGLNSSSCTIKDSSGKQVDGFVLFTEAGGAGSTAQNMDQEDAAIVGSKTGWLDMYAKNGIQMHNKLYMSNKQISNLAAGTANTDAVNVSQLKGVTTALGGGSAVNLDGTIKAPSYNVAGSTYSDVGSALAAVDAIAATGSADGVKYDTSAHDKITLAGGTAGTTITNLKAGAVNATSKDAINGSQLYTLAASEAAALGGGSTVNTDGSISKPAYTVDGKTVNGVDGAVNALDSRITDVSSSITEIAPKLKYIKFGETTALDATASGTNSVAIGGFAQAMADNSLAIGASARAMGKNSVAIGYGSSTSQDNTFAVGSNTSKRRVVNVADGTAITDAVTVGQMNTAIGAAIVNSGVKSNGMLGASTMLLGATQSSQTPDKLIVSGPTTLTKGNSAIGQDSIAVGLNNNADAKNAVAVGENVSVLGSKGVGVGQNIGVTADSGVSIGVDTSVVSERSVAIGNRTQVNTGSEDSVAIGSDVSVGEGQGIVAIGSNIVATAKNSVVLGANSADDGRDNTMSVGASASGSTGVIRRQIINVAAGTQDTDAVNVSQLKGVTSALGGGAAVNTTDGSIKKPTYNVAGGTYNDVGSALAAVDTKAGAGSTDAVKYDTSAHDKVSFSGTNGTTLSNVNAGTADKDAVNVAQLKAAGLNIDTSGTVTNSFVAYDDATKGKITLAGGTAGTTITNVKAGAVSSTSTDAINGSQLAGTAQSMADALGGGSTVDANGKISKPKYKVAGNDVTGVDGAISALDAADQKMAGDINTINGQMADVVKYDSSAHDKVTLAGGTNGTTLSNVKAGTADMDAVNMAQLKAAGLNVDTSGNVTNSFVAYDDTTMGKVTLGGGTAGTTIANVKAGDLSASSTDAVNGAQLYATNQDVAKNTGDISTLNTQITNINGQIADAVMYDTSAHDKVTLAGGSAGTTITNLKAGAVSSTSMDAINGSQLYGMASSTAAALGGGSSVDANGKIVKPSYNVAGSTYGDVGSALAAVDAKAASGSVDGVKYDTSAHDTVTFSGTNGTKLSNVTAGTADMDAVNMAQLKAAGLNVDTSGNVTNSFVAYDDTTMGKVTLGGGTAGTTIANVAAGAVSATSMDAINGSQLYNVANSAAAALGGGSTVGTDGSISMPEYTVGGKTVDGVDGAVNALDTRITDATKSMTEIAPKLKYIKFGETNALDASALGIDSVAIGGFAQAMGDHALAIGSSARAMADNAVAIGYGSSTSQANTFAVGSTTSKRRIVNVADATGVSDAVTLGQMNTAIGAAITNAGVKSNGMLGASTMLLGATSSQTPDKLIVSGPTTLTNGDEATGKNAIAAGLNVQANADNAVGFGQQVSVLGASGVAIGQKAGVSADSGVAIGVMTTSASKNAVAIGSNAQVNPDADDAVAIGSGVSVGNAKGTVAIGSNIVATAANSVVLGSNSSDDSRANTVSVGSSASTGPVRRQVINVAAGTQDTDAVNVSQLKGVTTALGGGASVNTDGSIKKPTYNVAGNTYSDVGSALAAVDAKAATGSVDGVTYDTSAHDKVSFSGANGTKLSNVMAATADTDAVNLAQLKAAGLNVDTSGNVTNSFVAYDDATKGKITMAGGTAGTTITNVKAGDLSASSTDAVNGSQLYATNQNVSSLTTQITNINGKMADAVMYDTSAHDKVTLGGGTAGTTITNLKAGAVSSASTDAINGSQLYNTANSTAAALGGGSTVNADGTVKKPSYNVAGSTYGDVGAALAAVDAKAATGSVDGVKYDTSAHDKVSFSGANGTILSNVNAGTADKDAVNVAQLKAAGLNIDTSGNVTNSFVSYDDATKGKITMGGTGGTTIANVKAGAVNATSKDAINGSQLYNVANSTATALGGGSTVNADGSISAPAYSLNEGSTTVHTVGDAISNLDGRVTQNTGDINDIKNTLVDGGVIDGTTGKSLAVVYDSAAKDSVTFGGKGATAPVALHNVAAGELSASSTDAVNGSQLYTTNKRIDDINHNMGNIGDVVMYDTSAHDRITLGGIAGGTTAPVILSNVADGKSKYDAVNFGQLSALQGQVTNLDNRVTVVEGQVTNMSGGGSSWNNDAGGNKIVNVAAGTEATDAVNVGQLNDAVASANSYTDSRVGDLPQGMTSKDYIDQSMKSMQSQVNTVAKNSYGGIAAATALTMIPDVDQGKTIAVGVGTGNYKGYQAVALGASARITQNLKVKIGAGMSPGNGTTVGAGASYQW
jgi:trimeric autotransporter adhesin